MSKIIDITDKLNFEEKPKIKIKDVEISINNNAVAMLKIIPKFSKKKIAPEDILEVINLILTKEEAEKVEKLGLGFEDYMTFIEAAVSLITGSDGSGEIPTPATT